MLTLVLLLAQADPDARDFWLKTPERGVTFTISSDVRAWWPELRGRAALDKVLGIEAPGDDPGPDFDFASDGGLGDRVFVRDFSLEIGRFATVEGALSIRARWWSGEWSASHVLQDPGDFGGPVLPAGSLVESEFEIDVYRLELTWRSRVRPNSPWMGAVFVGLGLFQTELHVDTPLGGSRDRAGGGFASAGFEVSWHPASWIFAGAEASFIAPIGVPMADLAVSGGLELGPLRIEGGYRWTWASMEAWSETLQFAMDGPFLELDMKF
jgi:hypothetical protein